MPNQAAPAGECTRPAEQRAERRTNLFVIAALYGRGEPAPTPVTIRDLSPNGALIEGTKLPEARTAVHLTRGSVSVAGELLWSNQTRAGLRFACPVIVAEWLPGGVRNSGQQRVDRMLLEARAGRNIGGTNAVSPAASRPDYAAVARSLTAAGEALLADPEVAQRHAEALQTIDIAAQALEQLAKGQ